MIQKLDNLRLDPPTAFDENRLKVYASTHLNIDVNRINAVVVTRRSIDARQRRINVNLSANVFIDENPPAEPVDLPVDDYRQTSQSTRQAIVVGAGPAGLFAALRLIELGIRPIVLERGLDVDARRHDMAAIARQGVVNPDSNYCFGEGGAGAYSDGKLYTRSKKRGPVDKILSTFYRHGAPQSILIDAHPHIGSDKLPSVIKAIRQTIEKHGGQVLFNQKVTKLIISPKPATVTGVETASGQTYSGPVILATGHSARDVYHMLLSHDIRLEPKGIAVGVRLEHPQKLIDQIQYHSRDGRGKWLPAAEYSMLTRVDNRAVYSFCMCPGGVIIPASSSENELVVNGMSNSGRTGRFCNSGMVVEILPDDIPGSNPLKMMAFQQEIEHRFFADANSYNAPAQRMTDFVCSKPSQTLPPTSYAPGIHPARIDQLLPPEVARRLQKGFEDFGRKQRGFLTPEATLIGCETRTSAPVRMPRDPETLCHTDIRGLFPAGEGAGYAGGIVSAAIDGQRAAEALSAQI